MGIFKDRRYYINKLLSVPVYIKITGVLFLIVVILEFVTIISIYVIFYKQDQLHLKESGNSTGKTIADMSEDYVESNDIVRLKDNLLFEINHSKILKYIIIRKNNGRIITYVSKKGFKIEQKRNNNNEDLPLHIVIKPHYHDIVNLSFPILNDDESGRFGPIGTRIGTILIGLSWGISSYFFKIIITFMVFVFLPLVIFIIVLFGWISLSILKPITDLSVATDAAKNGNYNILVQKPKFVDEKLAGLIDGFNNMLSAFKKIENKWETKDLRRKEFIEEIIKAQETERKKLSRELHDEMEQFLVYINMKFKVLEKLYGIGEENRDIEEMRSYIEKEFDNIKNITKELRPGVLYELGLYKAIMQYAEDIKFNHHMDVKIFTSGMEKFKAEEYIEINIYRIFQEVFSNIIRHSKATAIKITINFENSVFAAVIEDNGKGFNLGKADKKDYENFGIIGMKERAEILRGTLSIKTKAGRGTTITLNIPV